MKSKKITAVLLAICLMLSAGGFSAFAADNENTVSAFTFDDVEYTITTQETDGIKTSTVYGSDGSWAIAITDYAANTVQVITNEYDVTISLEDTDANIGNQPYDTSTRETWWMTASIQSAGEHATYGYHWDMTCLMGSSTLQTKSFWDYRTSLRDQANTFTAQIRNMIDMQNTIYSWVPMNTARNVASIMPNLPAVTVVAVAALLGDYGGYANMFVQTWSYLSFARSLLNNFPNNN